MRFWVVGFCVKFLKICFTDSLALSEGFGRVFSLRCVWWHIKHEQLKKENKKIGFKMGE